EFSDEAGFGVIAPIDDLDAGRGFEMRSVALAGVGAHDVQRGRGVKGLQSAGLGDAGPARAPALLQHSDLDAAPAIPAARNVIVAARSEQAGIATLGCG